MCPVFTGVCVFVCVSVGGMGGSGLPGAMGTRCTKLHHG